MASISSPQVLQIRNAANGIVVGSARSLQFIGGIVVTDGGDGKAVIDGTTGTGNPWDVLGNAGPGLLLGTNDANAWDMIVDGNPVAGFDAAGVFNVGGIAVKVLSADPSIGGGSVAPIGSLGIWNDAGAGKLYQKTGAGNTAWSQIESSAPPVIPPAWLLAGTVLTGATPDAPNEVQGSTNNYDLVWVRNGVEVMRLINDTYDGLIIGGTVHVGVDAAKLELQSNNNGATISRQSFISGGIGTTSFNRIGRFTTAGAVSTNLNFGINTDTNLTVRVRVVVKQTGGGTGALQDGASFVVNVALNNIAGVVTILSQNVEFSYAIDPGITLAITASGNALRVTGTGVAGRGLRWGVQVEGISG